MAALGRSFEAGSLLIHQGEAGDSMFVIQEGEVEILVEREGRRFRVGVAAKGEMVGEMAFFNRGFRSATVRALGPVRVLTVDKRAFMRRLHEDPSLSHHILQVLSRRLGTASDEMARLKGIVGQTCALEA